MSRTIAITGVGGFIGQRIAERASDEGYAVRGLEVSPQAARRASARGADVIVGDVNDPAAAARLCEGADEVVHTAAVVEEAGAMELFRRVNVDGTRTIALAAERAGVPRFVHLSSVMVYGFRFSPNVTEEGPLRGHGNPYCETKIESERVAMRFHAPGRMDVVVLRPGDVYGPGSVPWIVRPMDLMKRHLFALPDGGRGLINHVYVDNLVDAILLALHRASRSGVGGEAFTVSDGRATPCREFFRYHTEMLGQRPVREAPAPVIRGIAAAAVRVSRALGRPSPVLPQAVAYLTRPHAYSIEKARRVLGYEPRVELEEGMRRVGEWYRSTLASDSARGSNAPVR